MVIPNTLLQIIYDSIDLICNCKNEKEIQNVLSAQLECNYRKIFNTKRYPNAEIDLFNENEGYALEIKHNQKYYAGITQVLVQRIIYHIKYPILIHVHAYIDPKFINGFKKLIQELSLNGILIDKKNKKVILINNNERI